MANVALLATIADLKASQVAQAVSPVMPSGVILPYGGATAPNGWLVCDGTAYLQADYPELFAALSTTYNTQLNPVTGSNWAAPLGTQFRVPDMRGMFMRGEGTPSGLDAVTVGSNQVDKTKKNGLSVTNGTSTVSGTTNIGHSHGASSISVDNTDLAHGHGVNSLNGPLWTDFNTGGGPFRRYPSGASWVNASNEYYATNSLGNHSHSGTAGGQSLGTSNISLASGSGTAQTATVSSTDNETRPINRGVKYIIKV